jgi:hypothetical protein
MNVDVFANSDIAAEFGPVNVTFDLSAPSIDDTSFTHHR